MNIPPFFFVVTFHVFMGCMSTAGANDCTCNCFNGTYCYTLEDCDCTFPHLTFTLPYCGAGDSNAVELEMVVTGIHSTTITLNKKLFFERGNHTISGRYFLYVHSPPEEHDFYLYGSRSASLSLTILNTRLSDTGLYQFTVTEMVCPSSDHGDLMRKQLFDQVYNLTVSERSETSPKCFAYEVHRSQYTLHCSLSEADPHVEIDIVSDRQCDWRKLKSQSGPKKIVTVTVSSCDLASIVCVTRQNGSLSSTSHDSIQNCTFHVLKTEDTGIHMYCTN